MNMNQTRNYNCKNEELPVICGYAAFTLRRDLKDFQNYSPKFSEDYAAGFEVKITAATELVNPKTETAESKAITARMYATADGLIDSLNRLEGYLKLAKAQIPVSAADFGIPVLRKKINRRDTEGVLQNLRLVTSNVYKYNQPLTVAGLNDSLMAHLENAAASIAADNIAQYEILTRRIELVKNNVYVLNDLYAQLTEICEIGKILYKQKAPEKVKEYTFNYLLKKVRHDSKNTTDKNTTTE
ncbi:MAG: hypothetical protein LBC47_08775 [Tannerella sp.]|jgi:hypothetical protein|nr:hypothetical protein [Tannerella sp.]